MNFNFMHEDLVHMVLAEAIGSHGGVQARQMMNTARYIADRGHVIPVVTTAEDGHTVGVIYDGYWAVEP